MESGGANDGGANHRECGGDTSGDTSADRIETLATQTRKRKNRGPAKFKSKPGQPKIIDEWGYNEQPIGSDSNSFVTDVGNLVRARVNINVKSWKHVSDELKKQMWEEITRDYVIDESKRKLVFKKMAKLHRGFRNLLRRKYIKKVEPITEKEKDKQPYETYKDCFSKEDWLTFVENSENPEFVDLSKKNSENSQQNKYPHLMGRRGYAKSIPMWEDTGLVNKFSTDTESASSSGVRSGEYPRHVYWFCARVALDSENKIDYPNPQIMEATEKLHEVTADVASGKFVPKGAKDILSAVVGPDRCRRAKGFGGHQGYSHYFGRKSRSVGKEKDSIIRLEVEKYKSEIKAQYEEQIQSLKDDMSRQVQEALARVGIVDCSKTPNASSSPVTSRGCRESVHSRVHEQTSSLSFVDGARCSLALMMDGMVKIVAEAEAYNAKVLHNIPMMAGHVKVNITMVVEEFRELELPVPLESASILLLGQAEGTYVQWPRDLVFLEGENPLASSHNERGNARGNTGKRKCFGTLVNPREGQNDSKHPLVTKDILEKLTSYDLMLHDMLEWLEPQYCQFFIPLPREVFNYTSDDFTSIINREDLRQYFSGESLNISIIQGFMLYLSSKMKDIGVSDIGFLCPEICSQTSLNYDKTTTKNYLMRALKSSFDKNLILLPYNQSHHWILIAICPRTRKCYLFDPAYTPETILLDELQFPFKVAAMNKGVRNAALSFEKVKCRKQPGATECGYYVMRYMYEIIYQNIRNIGSEWRINETSYSTMELNEIRNEWAKYFVHFISK